MATVLQNYRLVVRVKRPNARLIIVDGCYQIMDGDEALTGLEVSPTVAWREAEVPFAERTFSKPV